MVEKPRVLIIFTSLSGNTEALAHAIEAGARRGQNVEVEVKRARDVRPSDVERAAALAFGSPTYYSYMSGELKSLFDEALPYRNNYEGKPAIAFSTGEGGQLKAIESIENILSYFGVSFVQKSDILSAGLAVQGTPDEAAKRQAAQAGEKLANAGIRYVCEKARREKGLIIGEHPGHR